MDKSNDVYIVTAGNDLVVTRGENEEAAGKNVLNFLRDRRTIAGNQPSFRLSKYIPVTTQKEIANVKRSEKQRGKNRECEKQDEADAGRKKKKFKFAPEKAQELEKIVPFDPAELQNIYLFKQLISAEETLMRKDEDETLWKKKVKNLTAIVDAQLETLGIVRQKDNVFPSAPNFLRTAFFTSGVNSKNGTEKITCLQLKNGKLMRTQNPMTEKIMDSYAAKFYGDLNGARNKLFEKLEGVKMTNERFEAEIISSVGEVENRAELQRRLFCATSIKNLLFAEKIFEDVENRYHAYAVEFLEEVLAFAMSVEFLDSTKTATNEQTTEMQLKREKQKQEFNAILNRYLNDPNKLSENDSLAVMHAAILNPQMFKRDKTLPPIKEMCRKLSVILNIRGLFDQHLCSIYRTKDFSVAWEQFRADGGLRTLEEETIMLRVSNVAEFDRVSPSGVALTYLAIFSGLTFAEQYRAIRKIYDISNLIEATRRTKEAEYMRHARRHPKFSQLRLKISEFFTNMRAIAEYMAHVNQVYSDVSKMNQHLAALSDYIILYINAEITRTELVAITDTHFMSIVTSEVLASWDTNGHPEDGDSVYNKLRLEYVGRGTVLIEDDGHTKGFVKKIPDREYIATMNDLIRTNQDYRSNWGDADYREKIARKCIEEWLITAELWARYRCDQELFNACIEKSMQSPTFADFTPAEKYSKCLEDLKSATCELEVNVVPQANESSDDLPTKEDEIAQIKFYSHPKIISIQRIVESPDQSALMTLFSTWFHAMSYYGKIVLLCTYGLPPQIAEWIGTFTEQYSDGRMEQQIISSGDSSDIVSEEFARMLKAVNYDSVDETVRHCISNFIAMNLPKIDIPSSAQKESSKRMEELGATFSQKREALSCLAYGVNPDYPKNAKNRGIIASNSEFWDSADFISAFYDQIFPSDLTLEHDTIRKNIEALIFGQGLYDETIIKRGTNTTSTSSSSAQVVVQPATKLSAPTSQPPVKIAKKVDQNVASKENELSEAPKKNSSGFYAFDRVYSYMQTSEDSRTKQGHLARIENSCEMLAMTDIYLVEHFFNLMQQRSDYKQQTNLYPKIVVGHSTYGSPQLQQASMLPLKDALSKKECVFVLGCGGNPMSHFIAVKIIRDSESTVRVLIRDSLVDDEMSHWSAIRTVKMILGDAFTINGFSADYQISDCPSQTGTECGMQACVNASSWAFKKMVGDKETFIECGANPEEFVSFLRDRGASQIPPPSLPAREADYEKLRSVAREHLPAENATGIIELFARFGQKYAPCMEIHEKIILNSVRTVPQYYLDKPQSSSYCELLDTVHKVTETPKIYILEVSPPFKQNLGQYIIVTTEKNRVAGKFFSEEYDYGAAKFYTESQKAEFAKKAREMFSAFSAKYATGNNKMIFEVCNEHIPNMHSDAHNSTTFIFGAILYLAFPEIWRKAFWNIAERPGECISTKNYDQVLRAMNF